MYKVLLVDDEPLIHEGLAEYINWEAYGLEIAEHAFDGAEALELFEKNHFHILITDVRMPRMGGLELIKRITELHLNVKFIVLSGYNDFEYVKEAAKLGIENYILKPVDEIELIPTLLNAVNKLESEMQKNIQTREGIQIIRENILLRWVTGDIDGEELMQRASLLDMELKDGDYQVAVIRALESIPEISPFKKADKRLLRFAIHNICEQLVQSQNWGTTFQDLNGDIIILFRGFNLTNKTAEINGVLAECINQVNTLLKFNVFVTVGRSQLHYLSVYHSYNNAKLIQDYHLILPSNAPVFYEEIENNAKKRQLDIPINFEPLNLAIRTRDKKLAAASIEEIINTIQQTHLITQLNLNDLIIEIVLNLIGVIKLVDAHSQSTFSSFKQLLTNIYEFKTLHELKLGLISIIVQYIDTLNLEEDKVNPIIKKVLEYTRLNYTKDINLKTVAVEFNLNAFYLGQLFTKETEMNFNNFLNNLRIEKAKDLLKSKTIKANQIAQMVGYVNTNYFSTIFKKMTGMTPTEYKED